MQSYSANIQALKIHDSQHDSFIPRRLLYIHVKLNLKAHVDILIFKFRDTLNSRYIFIANSVFFFFYKTEYTLNVQYKWEINSVILVILLLLEPSL